MKCKVCGRTIAVLIFRGTGICCDICRKVDDGVITPYEGVNRLLNAGVTMTSRMRELLDAQYETRMVLGAQEEI